MGRCLALAKLGEGKVAPNPMVGAILVHDDRIIGEGFHQQFGEAHAEVNCLKSVQQEDLHLISQSTLYVSLEPCSHFGKTPPCTDLILKSGIRKLVVACRDPFEKVGGSGISLLRQAGIEVLEHVLEAESMYLNRHFFHFHTHHKPYVTLKWAETNDGYISAKDYGSVAISHAITNRWVHRMRANHMAIMVGYNTAKYDDPSLTTRLWPGKNPIRIVIDKQLQLNRNNRIFSDEADTIVLNQLEEKTENNVGFILVKDFSSLTTQLMDILYQKNIVSLLVEGGTTLLETFINEGCWNEAWKIKSSTVLLESGIKAPILHASPDHQFRIGPDDISFFKKD